MRKQSFFSALKEKIGDLAFRIFCWSIEMTEEQYITALANEATRGYLEAAEQSKQEDGDYCDCKPYPTEVIRDGVWLCSYCYRPRC